MLALALLLAPPPTPAVAFPPDPWVLDAKRDLGAKGDGVADDTDALQTGIDLSSGYNQKTTKILYLPAGTYRVTRTLVVKNPLGPWLYGAGRDLVRIKLADGAKGVTAVLRTHPSDGEGHTSADWFMRTVRYLTIDAGDNPQADGVRWFSTNTGSLADVRVVGNGPVGVNSGFLGQNGPNLIQDVTVEGFKVGVKSHWNWGQTLSRVTLKNCDVGLSVEAAVVAAERLVTDGCKRPVEVRQPNDWHWWAGVCAVVGGEFRGGSEAAVHNRGILYARDLTADGYPAAIDDRGKPVAGPAVAEFASLGVKTLFSGPTTPIRLSVKPEPADHWESDPAKWECANDHGAVAGDNQDDTAAVQKAIDAAAAVGKTTVYFRGCGGGDPNHYALDGEVRVRGSVRHVLGLGWARLLGKGRLVVGDDAAPVVAVRHLDAFGGPPVTVENRSRANTLVVRSCGVNLLGTGTGDIFATDCPARVELTGAGQKVWCRHLNPEGDTDTGLVVNRGADLWALGIKHEGRGVRVRAVGGRTELFGVFNYGPGLTDDDRRTWFDLTDARLGVYAVREIAFGGHTWRTKVIERRGGVEKALGQGQEHGWTGWSGFVAGPAK
jgi:hypothetical protein